MIKFTDSPLARPVSDTINAHVLAASTAESDTIPAGAKYVVIKTTGPAFFRVGATASIPADTTDGSAAEYIDVSSPTTVLLPSAQTNTDGTVPASTTALKVQSLDGFTKNNSITIVGAGTAGADHTTTISAINATTRVITLASGTVTAVTNALVSSIPTTISLIAAATPTVTLSYYK
jgi:hypothetical protein